MWASAVRTQLQPNLFFFSLFFCFVLFLFSIRNVFFPSITTLKLHISYKISLVSPYCYFFISRLCFFLQFPCVFSSKNDVVMLFVNGCDFKFTQSFCDIPFVDF